MREYVLYSKLNCGRVGILIKVHLCFSRNLQAAVGAFYDHYSSEGGVLPEMTLVDRKSTGGDVGTALTLPGNTIFTETWTLRNTGE